MTRVLGLHDGMFARFDFICASCGKKRSFYMTPPHPQIKLPREYTHKCPDCGAPIHYSVNYDSSGRLYVDVSF